MKCSPNAMTKALNVHERVADAVNPAHTSSRRRPQAKALRTDYLFIS